MKLDADALRRNDRAALAELMKVCSKCARIGTSKVGALGFADDIAQDMAMVVLEKFLPSYDGEREIEPFLIEMARRMGLSYYRRHSREPAVGERPDGADPITNLEDAGLIASAQAEEDEEDRAALAARNTLVARMRERAAARNARPAQARKPAPAKSRRRRRVPDSASERLHHVRQLRAMRPAVRELISLRHKMGLTQQQMALELNLTPNAIRSLEYGVVRGNPEALLEKARALAAANASDFDASEPAAKLMLRWCRKLGLPADDMSGLSSVVGVHRSTLFRWRTERTQPQVSLLREINTVVETVADYGR